MMAETDFRITVERLSDYAWPYVAKLEAHITADEWQEIDAWGGDTEAEAIATLRAENRLARKVKVIA